MISRPRRTAKIAASLARFARSAPTVHREDRGPLGQRGQRDRDLTVEPAGTQQRGIEHLGAVRGGKHHDALGHVEAIHLRQQLIQRLLALVVGDDS
jgi:hypothetical protein